VPVLLHVLRGLERRVDVRDLQQTLHLCNVTLARRADQRRREDLLRVLAVIRAGAL
jgi:hypothetical protein